MHKRLVARLAMDCKDLPLPTRFCWTRFGVEAGQAVEHILERKEHERQAHDGTFLWGIGNSVGPAIRELVRAELTPMVVFSPMRSVPKAIDVAPSGVMAWTHAQTLTGEEWQIPPGLRVLSRAATDGGVKKRSHYALVCRSERPLKISRELGELDFGELVNLLSCNKLGHSQVTSVVQRRPGARLSGPKYQIGFIAELVYPYFVRLLDPVDNTTDVLQATKAEGPRAYQRSLLSA